MSIRRIPLNVENLPDKISLGRGSENEAVQLAVDVSAWVNAWPACSISINFLRPFEDIFYTVSGVLDGGLYTYEVTDTDTAIAGTGTMELVCTEDGKLAASAVARFVVEERLLGTQSPTPPEPVQSWYTRALQAADDAEGSAQRAETAAESIESIEPRVTALETNDAVQDAAISQLNQAKVDKVSMHYLELEHVKTENLYDVNAVQVGLVTKTGTYPSYTNYRYYIARGLTAGDILKVYYGRYGGFVQGTFYSVTPKDAQGVVDEEHYATTATEYTVPSGADTITFCFSGAKGSDEDRTTMIVANGFTPTEYISYFDADAYKATNDFLPVVDFAHLPDGVEEAVVIPSYFHRSPNMFNKDTQIEGYFVNQTNGNLAQGADYIASDWISVNPSTDYLITHIDEGYTNLRYALYDSNKSFISGALGQNALTTGETAAYIRFSFNSNRTQVQLQEGSVALPYEPYGQTYIKNEHLPPDVQTKEFDINVPDKLYALVGQELNVYFDCLVDTHDTDYTFNVNGIGMQLEKCWRIVPTSDQVGISTLTFTATNKDGKSVTKESTLIVSPINAGNGQTKKLIILGDSTTNNGIAVTKLNQNFSEDVMSIQTLGTRGTAPNNHEGRSGWTFYAYLTVQTDTGDPTVTNAFYNPSTHTFDADYYFDNSGIEKPDWFIVNLGINDTFVSGTDESALNNIETVIGRCETVLASIQSASPSTKIGIALTIPPNYSQDAFGKAYGVGQTRMRYKKNNFMWVKRLMEEYGDRENEGIYLIPIFTNLDTEHNMGLEDMQYNARNSDTYKSPIGNGGVHPVESGYWQIADVYWYFLKAHGELT